jgi:hypothetical protein
MRRWRPGLGWVLPKSDSLIGTCLGRFLRRLLISTVDVGHCVGQGRLVQKGQDEKAVNFAEPIA